MSSPVQIVLSPEKTRRIAQWAQEVEHHRSSCSSPSSPTPFPELQVTNAEFSVQAHHRRYPSGSNATDYGLPLALYHQNLDEAFDMDRWTVVFDGDKRTASLPHPQSNPLMTADLTLLQEEYISVIQRWSEFEMDKWRAERMLRGAATPDNVQRVYAADCAIEAACSAARYIERHTIAYGMHGDYDTLFFKYYQSPGFQPQPVEETYGWIDTPAAPSVPSYGIQLPSLSVPLGMGYQQQTVDTLPVFSQPTLFSSPFAACTSVWPAFSHAMPSLRTIQV